MKRRVLLIIWACFMLVIVYGVITGKENCRLQFQTDDDRGIFLEAYLGEEAVRIYPWENSVDNKYYFFLPSFCDTNRVFADGKQVQVYIDQVLCKKSGIEYQENREYELAYENTEGETERKTAVFMRSENIPAIFVNTESKSMDYLLQGKENAETGDICVIQEEGYIEYQGKLEKISGRGNSTWIEFPKKSFAITAEEEMSICGLKKGKKFHLLAVFEEASRMATKVAMDIAHNMELPYTVSNTWVDLYVNGEYEGNYLLSEPVRVGNNRVDIYDLEEENRQLNPMIDSYPVFEEENMKGYELPNVKTIDGGFLLEKDYSVYYDAEKSGFVTDNGNCFTIKEPEHASREQVEYIRDFVQEIENMIMSGDMRYLDYIDRDSFTKRYILDEISLNGDANIASMFFYKERGQNILYAGPVWDYDKAMGECNSGWAEGTCVDYTWSINNAFKPERLQWNEVMYTHQDFYEDVRRNFKKILPYMEYLIDEKIDLYREMIEASVHMDRIRWKKEIEERNCTGSFQEFENNVRYLKYYLTKRMNFLIERWEIKYPDFVFEGNGDIHEVKLVVDDEVVGVRMVQDGDEIRNLPELDEEQYWGWYYTFNMEKSRDWIPVFEDCILFAREKKE